MQCGIFQVPPLILVDIRDEAFAPLVQPAQEGRFLAITAIHGDVAVAHAPPVGVIDHRQRQFGLAAIDLVCFRNRPLLAAVRVRNPGLRQVQAGIDQTRQLASTQRSEHLHLAVIDLAEAPIPLPCHVRRGDSLLGEAALVQDEHGLIGPEQGICLSRHGIEQAGPVDTFGSEHVLHGLRIGGVDFTHAQHGAPFGLEEAEHIGAEDLGGVARAGEEKTGKPVKMGAKRLREAGKGTSKGGGVKFTETWLFTVNIQ
jgi:hypothetical protein